MVRGEVAVVSTKAASLDWVVFHIPNTPIKSSPTAAIEAIVGQSRRTGDLGGDAIGAAVDCTSIDILNLSKA